MPQPNPLTELRELAGEIARFADALAAETDFDTRVLRYWHARLLGIAAALEARPPGAGGGG